jgi:hypothetical protein
VLVATALGALILVPSLALLFGMVLRGRFDERPEEPGSLEAATTARDEALRDEGTGASPPRQLTAVAAGLAGFGVVLMLVVDGGAVLYTGLVLLLAGVGVGGAAVLPAVVEQADRQEGAPPP